MKCTLACIQDRHFAILEVSAETSDRFRDTRLRVGWTIAELLLEVAEIVAPGEVVQESDIIRFLDWMDDLGVRELALPVIMPIENVVLR